MMFLIQVSSASTNNDNSLSYLPLHWAWFPLNEGIKIKIIIDTSSVNDDNALWKFYEYQKFIFYLPSRDIDDKVKAREFPNEIFSIIFAFIFNLENKNFFCFCFPCLTFTRWMKNFVIVVENVFFFVHFSTSLIHCLSSLLMTLITTWNPYFNIIIISSSSIISGIISRSVDEDKRSKWDSRLELARAVAN